MALWGCKKSEVVAPPLNVTYVAAVKQPVNEMRTWVGLLDGFQNSDIKAQVTGYLISQNYKEGSYVTAGALLFAIDPRPFQAALAQAKADYAASVAKAQLAQITLDRQTQLYKTKVISQQEYDNSYQAAQADIAGAAAQQANVDAAQINLNYCTIKAPFDGIVGTAQAQVGDLVGPGGTSTVLTQMSQVDPIKVVFSITEQDYLGAADVLKKLQAGIPDDQLGRLSLRLADGTTYDQKGKFDFVNRQINVATGTIQITSLFPNPERVLRPGLFARVTAPVKELPEAIVVPQTAVVELQGNHLVSVVDTTGVVQTRPVLLGPVDGEMQVILKGIAAGERVIVGGVEKVKPGMKVNAQPAPSPTPPAKAASRAQGESRSSAPVCVRRSGRRSGERRSFSENREARA